MKRRSEIARREHMITFVLLAFCIDMLRPGVHPVAHSHPGDERPHVHAGDVSGRQRSAPERTLLFGLVPTLPPAESRGPAIAASSTISLHVHLARPLHAADVAPIKPAVLIRPAGTVLASAAGRELIACVPPGHARAPPTASA